MCQEAKYVNQRLLKTSCNHELQKRSACNAMCNRASEEDERWPASQGDEAINTIDTTLAVLVNAESHICNQFPSQVNQETVRDGAAHAMIRRQQDDDWMAVARPVASLREHKCACSSFATFWTNSWKKWYWIHCVDELIFTDCCVFTSNLSKCLL